MVVLHMMGKKSGQMSMAIIDMESMIPEGHLLKKISQAINFQFIYDLAKPYYAQNGRPSIDPVSMIKMLLVGYLYGIRSERKLVEEVTLNIGYRWFCGFELTDRIPEHSLFSQNRRRRFGDNMILKDIFNTIIIRCIQEGIVTGEEVVSDGSFLPGNVSTKSMVKMTQTVIRSTVKYMDALDQELCELPGYRKPIETIEEKTIIKSSTDIDCGYIQQERKKGMGYLTEMTVDVKHGIITGVDCYAANRRESDIILEHIMSQMQNTGIVINKIALDAGYDVGAVHRGLELLGITDYCCPREMHNNALKKGFDYDAKRDCFKCAKGKQLNFYRIIYKQQNYYRLYRIPRKACADCERLKHCCTDKWAVRINASAFYPAYYANRQRSQTKEYLAMKRLRSIWSEGTFAALKNQHNLKRIRKRGILRATEECLFSALALNLKRIVGTISASYQFFAYLTTCCFRDLTAFSA